MPLASWFVSNNAIWRLQLADRLYQLHQDKHVSLARPQSTGPEVITDSVLSWQGQG